MLKGRLGDTQITVSGAIPRSSPSPAVSPETKRKISFQIASPLLDLDLFFPKKNRAGIQLLRRLQGRVVKLAGRRKSGG